MCCSFKDFENKRLGAAVEDCVLYTAAVVDLAVGVIAIAVVVIIVIISIFTVRQSPQYITKEETNKREREAHVRYQQHRGETSRVRPRLDQSV